MRPTLIITSVFLFASSIATFSTMYAVLGQYLGKEPTLFGLLRLVLLFALLVLQIMALGLIMYATDRRLGNVKVKNHLFERLLGYDQNATLPAAQIPAPDAVALAVKEETL